MPEMFERGRRHMGIGRMTSRIDHVSWESVVWLCGEVVDLVHLLVHHFDRSDDRTTWDEAVDFER